MAVASRAEKWVAVERADLGGGQQGDLGVLQIAQRGGGQAGDLAGGDALELGGC